MPTRQAKYPGRDRVMSRSDARDLLWRNKLGEGLAPWCDKPVHLAGIGLPGAVEALAGDTSKLPVEVRVACRKCAGCLKHRANLWAARASAEINLASRNWFVTLTVAPQHRFRLGLIAEKRFLRPSSEVLGQLGPDDQFRILCRVLGPELTKFLKRVRKNSGKQFRYIAVFERHKDGFPHLHLLIHEHGQSITKSEIQAEWRLGFSQCKLVDDRPGAAFYVAKYLSKEAATRVRSSLRYGNSSLELLTERLRERDADA